MLIVITKTTRVIIFTNLIVVRNVNTNFMQESKPMVNWFGAEEYIKHGGGWLPKNWSKVVTVVEKEAGQNKIRRILPALVSLNAASPPKLLQFFL